MTKQKINEKVKGRTALFLPLKTEPSFDKYLLKTSKKTGEIFYLPFSSPLVTRVRSHQHPIPNIILKRKYHRYCINDNMCCKSLLNYFCTPPKIFGFTINYKSLYVQTQKYKILTMSEVEHIFPGGCLEVIFLFVLHTKII